MKPKSLVAISIMAVLASIAGCSQATTRSTSTQIAPLSGETKTLEIRVNKDLSPSIIRVNQGDKVVLNLLSNTSPCIGGNPGIAIQDFNVMREFSPNEVTTLEFVADKKGTFTVRGSRDSSCTLCHRSMKGKIIVE